MRARRRGFIALSSISVVAALTTALSGLAPAFAAGGKPSSGGGNTINVTIDAFNRAKSPGVWTKGNTSGYAETNAIPFRLGLANGGSTASTVTSLETIFDFSDTASNGTTVPGIADLVTTPALANQKFLPGPNPTHDFAVCGALSDTPLPPTGTGAVAGSCTTIPWVPVGGSQSCQPTLTSGTAPSTGPYVQGPYCSAGGNNGLVQGKYIWHNVAVPAGQQVSLVWGALLALHSHLYNGSSLHMLIGDATVNNGTASFGNKDVPIPVNQILATATDKKVNGSDGPVPLTLGDTATVTITASAFGPKGSSQALTITDHLPNCLGYEDSATPIQPSSAPALDHSGDVIFGPITVAGGASTTVSFQVKAIAVNPTCDNVAVTTSNNPDVPPTQDDVQTPVSGVAALTISKDCTSGGTTPTPAGTIQQTLNFGNVNGTADATNVTVTDVLSAGQTVSNIRETFNGNPVTLTLGSNYSTSTDANGVTTLTFAVGRNASLPNGGTLQPGDSGHITYDVTFPRNSSTTDRTFTDTANIYSGTTLVASSSQCSATLHYLPDLGLAKRCPASAPLGSMQTHTLLYTADDLGTGPATNATIVDTLPSGASYVANSAQLNGNPITPTVGSNSAGLVTLTFALGTLQPGDSGSVTYSVTMTSSSPQTDSATISSTQTDRDSTDNTATCATGVTTIDVFVDKNNHCTTNTAVPGGTVTQTIDFGNTGNTAATGVVVTDVLDAGETFVKATLDDPNGAALTSANGLTTSAGPGTGQTTVTYTVGTLAPATSHTLYVTVRFAGTASQAGVVHYQDTASITTTSSETGGTANNSSGPCSTNVDYEPALTVTKTACPSDSVAPGGEIVYTLSYRNDGTAPATPATLTDDLPNDGNGHALVSVLDNGGGTESADHLKVTWTIPSIAIGNAGAGSKTLSVIVNAPTGSNLINKAELSSGSVSATPDTVLTLVGNGSANTRGNAYALDAQLLGTELIDHIENVSTSAPPGTSAAAQLGNMPISVPGLVTLNLLPTSSQSAVDPAAGEPGASSLATAEVTNVNLLGGLIKASAVKASSESSAGALTATYNATGQNTDSSTGSHFVNLQINGQPVCSVPATDECTIAPNTTVDVKDPTGAITVARAVLNEQIGSSSLSAAPGQNKSALSVNMIHVTVLKPLGPVAAGTEIVVSHAQTDAAYGSGFPCSGTLRSVSGDAYTAFAQGKLNGVAIATGQVGNAVLPATGGHASDTTTVNAPGVVNVTTASNTTDGAVSPFANATGHSVVTKVNILNGLITADALDVKADSTVGGADAYGPCENGTITNGTCYSATFLNLKVNGNQICASPGVPCSPDPNYTIAIPQPDGSLVLVVLNERITSGSGGNTAGDINAIHVFVLKGAQLQLEVVVAHAHSDAHG